MSVNTSTKSHGKAQSAACRRLFAAAVACLVGCGALALSTPASASLVRSAGRPDPTQLVYLAGHGEQNRVTVNEIMIGGRHWVQVKELTPRIRVRLGEGCRQSRPTSSSARRTPTGTGAVLGGQNGATVYCLMPEPPSGQALLEDSPRVGRAMFIYLDDMDDVLLANMLPSSGLVAHGEAGVDVLRGGAETDVFCSGGPVGSNDCSLSPGETSIDRSQMRLPFEILDGGAGNDVLHGTDASERLHGDLGNDKLWGRGGTDSLTGGAGGDNLNGGSGDDYLETSVAPPENGVQSRDWVAGNDRIYGGNGYDTYGFAYTDESVAASGSTTSRQGSGGPEQDHYSDIEALYLSRGSDQFAFPVTGHHMYVYGLDGNDRINISGDPDRTSYEEVSCGPGDDATAIDANDQSRRVIGPPIHPDGADSDCEHVDYVYP